MHLLKFLKWYFFFTHRWYSITHLIDFLDNSWQKDLYYIFLSLTTYENGTDTNPAFVSKFQTNPLFALPRIYCSIEFGSALFFSSSQILSFLVPVLPKTNLIWINRIWNDLAKKDTWRYLYKTSGRSLTFLGFFFAFLATTSSIIWWY